MSDIYHIPNDDGNTYRLKKFVEYQHEVPSIHYRFMGEYIKKKQFDKDRAVNMCWLMSVTYNEITCIILDKMLNEENKTPEQIWNDYKRFLNFGSARKYAKNNDLFIQLMNEWFEATRFGKYAWLKQFNSLSSINTCLKIEMALKRFSNVGRFASDLFVECVSYLKDYLGINIQQPLNLDWKNCANLTSGIFNIFYEDEKANAFDKTKKISEKDKLYLTKKLKVIQKEIKSQYPNQDNSITMFIGKICSFRNLFKNARYGGFHHDRQLGVIKEYEKNLPQYSEIYEECYQLRKEIFDKRFLGELNGWEGIRKERKKLWLTTGKTGVEKERAEK